MVAEVRNVDAVLQSGFQQIHAGFHLQGFAVDLYGNAHGISSLLLESFSFSFCSKIRVCAGRSLVIQ